MGKYLTNPEKWKTDHSIEVKYGRLYLDKLQVTLPEGMNANIVKASVNGKVIPASLTNTNGYTEVSLNGLQICANDKLQIDFE